MTTSKIIRRSSRLSPLRHSNRVEKLMKLKGLQPRHVGTLYLTKREALAFLKICTRKSRYEGIRVKKEKSQWYMKPCKLEKHFI